MKIAIDAMGGDNAPAINVEGALMALNKFSDLKLALVGKDKQINNLLTDRDYDDSRLTVISAEEVITGEEKPALALRRKKNTSIGKAAELVKNDDYQAVISAGNTGASLAAGILKIGRISGIKRPAIATILPGKSGSTLLLDMGANANAEPFYLQQFALMGQFYAKLVMEITNPKIGLMSVGEEEGKGNDLTEKAYQLIKEDQRIHNFAGNVEGRDIFTGKYDVIVTDGFTGNVILKTSEGLADFVFSALKEALTSNITAKLGALLVKNQLNNMKGKLDYKQYGGAPLLGLQGNVIIGHGSSDGVAISNAVRVARKAIQQNFVSVIASEIVKDGEGND